jgi:hypothetical protein
MSVPSVCSEELVGRNLPAKNTYFLLRKPAMPSA